MIACSLRCTRVGRSLHSRCSLILLVPRLRPLAPPRRTTNSIPRPAIHPARCHDWREWGWVEWIFMIKCDFEKLLLLKMSKYCVFYLPRSRFIWEWCCISLFRFESIFIPDSGSNGIRGLALIRWADHATSRHSSSGCSPAYGMFAAIDFPFATLPDSGPATSYDKSGLSRTLVGIRAPSTSSFRSFASFVPRQTRPRWTATGEWDYSTPPSGVVHHADDSQTSPLICSQRTSSHRHRTKRWDRRRSYPFHTIPICPVPLHLPCPHSMRYFPMMRTHHGTGRYTVHHPFMLKVNWPVHRVGRVWVARSTMIPVSYRTN